MGEELDLSGLQDKMTHDRHGNHSKKTAANGKMVRSNIDSKVNKNPGNGRGGPNRGGSGYGNADGRKGKGGGGSWNGGGNSNKRKPDWSYEGYVGAPYNFVPISKRTYDYKAHGKERQDHNAMKPELLSGVVEYTVEARTPIMIDGGKTDSGGSGLGEFYKDAYGRYAIQGSGIRGLVRGNAQILSFADVSEDIEDYYLMYRNVAAGADKDRYQKILGNESLKLGQGKGNVSVLKNVKAGYLFKKDGKYGIYATCLDKQMESRRAEDARNYYVVSERLILDEYHSSPEKSGFRYLYSGEFDRPMQYRKDCHFVKSVNQKTGKNQYKPENNSMFNGREGGTYTPFYCEVSYSVHGEKNTVDGIGAPDPNKKNGFLLSSGAMNMKKAIYIIPEMDPANEVLSIPQKDIDSFKRDFEGRKNQIKGNEKFYGLPEEGEIKPVFYIEFGGRLYFGFTPRLRLFYDKSVKEGLNQKPTQMDYCKALFGAASKEDSYKSRLSFQDACTEVEVSMGAVNLVLSGPKPTSYLDYIENAREPEEAATYNDDFQLRGIKQYWLKEEAEGESPANPKNDKVGSMFKPLPAGTMFQGKVHFRNLTEDELGLLLWSLELNEKSEQNIGKAKAYGYGRVKIRVKGLQIFQLEEAYGGDEFNFFPMKEEDKEPYIRKFKEEIKRWRGKEPEEIPSILDFLTMKDSTRIPPKERTRYMSINEGEFQERVKHRYPLQKVKEVARPE